MQNKYHGLGNDYLVLEDVGIHETISTDRIRCIGDRHYGVGAEGIHLGRYQVIPVISV